MKKQLLVFIILLNSYSVYGKTTAQELDEASTMTEAKHKACLKVWDDKAGPYAKKLYREKNCQ